MYYAVCAADSLFSLLLLRSAHSLLYLICVIHTVHHLLLGDYAVMVYSALQIRLYMTR